jgi:O-antigen ligase
MTPVAGRAKPVWREAAPAARDDPAPGGLLGLGFACFCFYVFAYYSRFLDRLAPQFHLPAVAIVIAISVAAMSGRFVEVFRHRIGLYMAGLTVCLAMAVPLAYWRGGSFGVFTHEWIPTFILFSVGASVTITVQQCRRGLYAIGLATGGAAVLVNTLGSIFEERLSLSRSRFANANTIAITLLLGMPLIWLLATSSRAGAVRKAFAAAILLVMVTGIFRSGSREGVVGLALFGVLLFFHTSAFGKVGIVVAAVVLAIGAGALMPESLKARFESLFVDRAVAEYQGGLEREVAISAAASFEIRRQMLMSSLKLTVQHPLLGIGPGNFAAYLADQAKDSNTVAYWVGAHNTYTQISSEAGIPALGFYLALLISSILALTRISRRANRIPGEEAHDIAGMGWALNASLALYCICALFNHMAYEPTMPLMAAIALAISRAAPGELSRLEAANQHEAKIPLAPSFHGPGAGWLRKKAAQRSHGPAGGINRSPGAGIRGAG